MKRLHLLILMLSPVFASGQAGDFKKLFCKTWELTAFIDEEGIKKDAGEKDRSTMTFNGDSTFSSSGSNGLTGKWTYTEANQTINMSIKKYKDGQVVNTQMKIIKLEADEMILETNSHGRTMKLVMKPL